MQWIQGIQVQKAFNLVGNWWCCLSNIIWVTKLWLGVSLVTWRNLSWYSLIKLERLKPQFHMMVKHEYAEYARKKRLVQVTKKQLTLWGKSSPTVVNVIIIYVGSMSLSFVKHALKTSKTNTLTLFLCISFEFKYTQGC